MMAEKVHINAQIMEVERELAMRGQVYPGWVSRGKMKQAQADLHMRQMEGVLETLKWCRDNQARIVAIIEGERA